jgi:hypothetical protein
MIGRLVSTFILVEILFSLLALLCFILEVLLGEESIDAGTGYKLPV